MKKQIINVTPDLSSMQLSLKEGDYFKISTDIKPLKGLIIDIKKIGKDEITLKVLYEGKNSDVFFTITKDDYPY